MSVSVDHNLGIVWKHEGGSAQWMLRREQLAWLTPDQRCRAERLRQAKLLFSGAHRSYFIDEGRSAFQFPELAANLPKFYRPLNLMTLVSRKTADLLFGESCRISIDDARLQAIVDQIADRSWLHATLLAAATECSWAGDTFLEVTRVGGEIRIGPISVDEIFPLGQPGPDRQYGAYVRYATAQVGGFDGEQITTLLLETYYRAGEIARKVFVIDATGGKVARTREVDIERWPVKMGDVPLPALERTGLTRCSIVYVPNGYEATSDYDGLIDHQDDVSAKNTQLARVHAKHADPKMYAPASAFSLDGKLDAKAEVFATQAGEGETGIPGYITWDAKLDTAAADRSFALLGFATAAEMPLSLLGIKDDSVAETASKMRLNAATALAKVQRVASFWQNAIRLVVSIAIEAETGSVPAKPIGVEMRDGLPVDEKERADTIALLRGANVISQRRALEAQFLEPTDIEAELRELEEEAKNQMPSTLLGEPSVAGAGATELDALSGTESA